MGPSDLESDLDRTPPEVAEAESSIYGDAPTTPSLREVHRSVVIPDGARFWQKLLAFSGPGFLVAVGYMDPGNWATDIAGGAQFGYTLLAVILLSNLMAVVLQALAV